ncbi:TIGR04149 family rSAM-modified RiPP [uncultured Bacteroides sp.]|jgi:natural product precursor|nr:TIGR04149 family rSAM-modified RiPP [uncultured Bacteroides sp.]
MKKLSKLKLKEFREMSDFEMKQVLGGFGDFEGGGTGNLEGGGAA